MGLNESEDRTPGAITAKTFALYSFVPNFYSEVTNIYFLKKIRTLKKKKHLQNALVNSLSHKEGNS